MKKEIHIVKEVHHYKIYQGKDGRWRTHVPDPTKKDGRRSVAKRTIEELMESLDLYYSGRDKCDSHRQPDSAVHENPSTFRELYPLWLEHKKNRAVSDVYWIRINADFRKYYQGEDIINVPLSELTSLMLEDWLLQKIRQYNLTKKAYFNLTLIFRQGLKYAKRIGLITHNVFDDVEIDTRRLLRRPKKKESLTQVFTEGEVERFAEAAWNDFRQKGKKVYRLAPLAALFMFYTGVRVGELTGIRFEDLSGGEVHIRRTVRKDDHKVIERTKTPSGDRFIPLTGKAEEIIAAVKSFLSNHSIPEEGFLFSEYERPLPSRIVEEYFEKYCLAIGTFHKSTHCARKTYVSALIDAGVNINTVREVVGHADESTTYQNYVYDRRLPEEKKQQFENALNY